MKEQDQNDIEIAPRSAIMFSAKEFAKALSETPQFLEFESSYASFKQDEEAQRAIREFQNKQASLKTMIMLNSISTEDKQELDRLQERFYGLPSVVRYIDAQQALVELSQEVGDLLSEAIGLDFASSCRTGGCCG